MPKNKIEIYGWGQEFIIGSLSENQVHRIVQEKIDINELFQNGTEMVDDVLHLYGPEMSEVSFLDKSEGKISIPNIVINYEPCWESVSKELLIQSLQEQCDDISNVAEVADAISDSKVFSNISTSESYLIQRHAEKGYWGDFIYPNNKYANEIFSLSVEMEGMEISANMLIGFLVKDCKGYSFEILNTDGGAEGKTKEYYIFTKHKGIIWEL